MKGFISLSSAATREQSSIDDLLRLGESGDLPMYIEGKQFILSPDFSTSLHRPVLAIPLTGLFAFKYNGPIRLSTGAIGIVRDKGSAPANGPQTFFYLEDHTRENLTPLLSHIHPQYRKLPPSSYDFFHSQKPLFVVLKSSGLKTVGIQGEDLPILVKNNDLARLFAPKATLSEQRSFEDIIIDVARQRLKNYPDLMESFLYHKVNNPPLGGGISRWMFEFSDEQGLTSSLTPPEIRNTVRNEFITKKIDAWVHEYEEEHGGNLTIQPADLGTPSQLKRTNKPRRQREDLLTPIINKLQSECSDEYSAAELWPKLVSLAIGENRPAPLIGYADDCIKWERQEGNIAFFSKKNLSDRLNRLKTN